MKIIKVQASYKKNAASTVHIYVRINAQTEIQELELKEKFHAKLKEVREAYLIWWGMYTEYYLRGNLETTVKELQDEGEVIELIEPADKFWDLEL